jgi:tetratricopeptide (TPR) repeat protein
MNKSIRKAGNRLAVFLILSVLFPSVASSADDSMDGIWIEKIESFEEMEAALAVIETFADDDDAKNAFTTGLQKKVLTRSGECISRLAYLCRLNTYDPDTVRQRGKDLFSANRDIIHHILTINEQIIVNFQEGILDTMDDPMAFFKTPQWQGPQQLISLSSYWMGWNGYYASLVIPENDPVRRQMLVAAIEGFSRAFIDFEEEEVIAKSLFGRGLCYRQLGDFRNALYDFKTVKDRTGKDDSLTARCLFEEAGISYETGNLRLALGKLDQIREVYPDGEIPEAMAAGMEELRANVLLARLEKKGRLSGERAGTIDENYSGIFDEMKMLAVQDGRINENFYRYVQANADRLSKLSYDELGPVAAMAIGDWYYEKEAYDEALSHYRKLHSGNSLPFSQNLDRLTYRTAYIYYLKQQWREVTTRLKGFSDGFPESWLKKEAASLYYTAAANRFREHDESGAYETYIDAIRMYLAVCDGCNGRSEARFQLGEYYRKNGKPEHAVKEFIEVREDSPNFHQAKYYVLESCVEALQLLSEKGHPYTEEIMRVYGEGQAVADEYTRAAPDEKAAANLEKLQPYMAVLQARFHVFGGPDAWESGFGHVQGFEGRYPQSRALFLDAAKLRIEYSVLLRKDAAFEAEVKAFINNSPVDQERYAALHELADRFYLKSKKEAVETEKGLPSRLAAASLSIYEKLHGLSSGNAAYEHYCEAIELRMAEICMTKNRIEDAAELFSNVLRRNPESADAVYGLGLIYEQQAQWRQALEIWRKFSDGVEAGTYHWFQSRYRTAVALHQLGETGKACTVVTMTRVLHPDFGDDELEMKFSEMESRLCKEETLK